MRELDHLGLSNRAPLRDAGLYRSTIAERNDRPRAPRGSKVSLMLARTLCPMRKELVHDPSLQCHRSERKPIFTKVCVSNLTDSNDERLLQLDWYARNSDLEGICSSQDFECRSWHAGAVPWRRRGIARADSAPHTRDQILPSPVRESQSSTTSCKLRRNHCKQHTNY
jgi:hypothetical protein